MNFKIYLLNWQGEYVGVRGEVIVGDDEYISPPAYLASHSHEAIKGLVDLLVELEQYFNVGETLVDEYIITNDPIKGLNEDDFKDITKGVNEMLKV